MLLAFFFDYTPYNYALLFGVIASVAIPLWLAFILRARRRRTRTLRQKVAARHGPRQVDLDKMLNWLPLEMEAERRNTARRAGPPTDARLTLAPNAEPPVDYEALVLDRAEGGLCIAIERPFKTGDKAFLRVEGAEPDFPWVAVTVRHCRNCGDFFLVGCAFDDEALPLTVRLRFG